MNFKNPSKFLGRYRSFRTGGVNLLLEISQQSALWTHQSSNFIKSSRLIVCLTARMCLRSHYWGHVSVTITLALVTRRPFANNLRHRTIKPSRTTDLRHSCKVHGNTSQIKTEEASTFNCVISVQLLTCFAVLFAANCFNSLRFSAFFKNLSQHASAIILITLTV